MRVFDVHYLVAYIVGSLYEVYQRMTCVAQRLAIGGQSQQPEVVGDAFEGVALGAEESELAVLASVKALERIFHDACKHGVCHHETALAASVEAVCEQSEGVGVALKVYEVVPKLWRQLAL